MNPIDLDYNATTPLDPVVAARMLETARTVRGNPASLHQLGRQARYVIEQAADEIARHLGLSTQQTPTDRVIFTSGGTEANNLALLGLTHTVPGRVVVSAIEHPSTIAASQELVRRGWQVETIRVLPSGVIDLMHLAELLERPVAPPQLVSIMLANHETGVIQPVAEAAQLCTPFGVPVHTDAAQAIGKIEVDFHALGVAALTVVPHKFYGPCGIGALAVRATLPIRAQLFGGGQQLGSRPGTESPALVVGFAAALERITGSIASHSSHLSHLRNRWESTVRVIDPRIAVNGEGERVGSTTNLSFVGRDRQGLLMALDRVGICCSAGSACASGSTERSPVLLAMGLTAERVDSALRFSVGASTTEEEIDEASERLRTVLARLQRLA